MRVIVVGAGPGGAAAAIELARGGADVRLVERSAWPRPKTCGDGVSPLAICELARLGVRLPAGPRLERALVTTPRETAFRGGFPSHAPHGTIVERRILDEALVDAASAAGADFGPSTHVRSLHDDGERIVAEFAAPAGERRERYDAAILAEGATGSLAGALGFPPYRSRLVSLRGYADAVRDLAPEYGIYYDRELTPGYGWIFPVSARRANVGVIVDERVLARRGSDLRALLHRWLARSAICRDLLGDAPQLDALRGGVIPSGRRRRTLGRVFLVGDAAGVADPFTAEGVYEAMRSGADAARALLAEPGVAAAATRYERALRTLDRNERAARGLRATFGACIEPFARRASTHAPLADRLNTDVFFTKRSFTGVVLRMLAASVPSLRL